MAHLPQLITDLTLILGAAAVIIILFRWLRQPLVLGYIIAGFLVGPYFSLVPTIQEGDNIKIWAEIGVIFLLFSLGLEFSFKKLLKVGGSASITAITEVVIMVLLGYGVGILMGWNQMDSLFLGGILSISSTTIIIRAFEELGVKARHFAVLVFGVLIVEDLVAIVLLVLLSTLAVSRQFAGNEMLFSILKLIFFLLLWFLMGIFFIPTLLRKTKKLLTDEMLLILSIAFCFFMVFLADKAGFSPALGAFIMGSMLAETTKAEKIEHLIKPVKDFFGAIFFVSVGMLIDPAILVEFALPILVICLVTIVGKILSTSIGALLSGQSLQTAVQAGFSLAQIGEFSFIIATLGLTLKVTSEFLYPIAVAVSAVTTLTTPYLIKSSDGFTRWLEKILPNNIRTWMASYRTNTRVASHRNEWRVYIRSTIILMVLLSVVLISITLIADAYLIPFIMQNGSGFLNKLGAAILVLILMLPFLWALAIRNPAVLYARIIQEERYQEPLAILRILRLCVATIFIGLLLMRFFTFIIGAVASVAIIVLVIRFSNRIQRLYNRLEKRFLLNLNQREIAESERNRVELAPWDAHIIPLAIEPGAPCIGKTLRELAWRESAGVNVVMIKRGDMQIPVPGREERIFPQDELLILGTDLQVKKIQALCRPKENVSGQSSAEVRLLQYELKDTTGLTGKSIRESGIREKGNCLIVGVERENKRILNPDSETVLLDGDVVFLVGDKKKLDQLFEQKPLFVMSK
ncbi:MAG: sodium:proton antiporter [Chitinophagaceae bacterium]|nr:MAG: sodium:proton antiporter [Chitinophagaceae bacterium]